MAQGSVGLEMKTIIYYTLFHSTFMYHRINSTFTSEKKPSLWYRYGFYIEEEKYIKRMISRWARSPPFRIYSRASCMRLFFDIPSSINNVPGSNSSSAGFNKYDSFPKPMIADLLRPSKLGSAICHE